MSKVPLELLFNEGVAISLTRTMEDACIEEVGKAAHEFVDRLEGIATMFDEPIGKIIHFALMPFVESVQELSGVNVVVVTDPQDIEKKDRKNENPA